MAPCTGTQVGVLDRTKVVPNPSETQVLQPPGLQPRIDQAVAAFTSGGPSSSHKSHKSAPSQSGSVPPLGHVATPFCRLPIACP